MDNKKNKQEAQARLDEIAAELNRDILSELNKLGIYVEGELSRITGNAGIRISQLQKIERSIQPAIDEWRRAYEELARGSMNFVVDSEKAAILGLTDIVESEKIDDLVRAAIATKLDDMSDGIISKAFTRRLYSDNLNFSERIWLSGNENKKEIMQEVSLGALRGESSPKVARRIRSKLKNGQPARNATRLARNELKNIANDASFQFYRKTRTEFHEFGVGLVQQYFGRLDGKERETHGEASGKFILDTSGAKYEQSFVRSNRYMYRSTAMELLAEVNCRCLLIDVILEQNDQGDWRAV